MFNWKVFLETFGVLIVSIFVVVSVFVALAIIGAIIHPLIGVILPIMGLVAVIAAITAYKHP